MTYFLELWREPRPTSHRAGGAIFASLGGVTSAGSDVVAIGARIQAVVGPNVRVKYVGAVCEVQLREEGLEKAAAVLEAIAKETNLVLFDPQQGAVIVPRLSKKGSWPPISTDRVAGIRRAVDQVGPFAAVDVLRPVRGRPPGMRLDGRVSDDLGVLPGFQMPHVPRRRSASGRSRLLIRARAPRNETRADAIFRLAGWVDDDAAMDTLESIQGTDPNAYVRAWATLGLALANRLSPAGAMEIVGGDRRSWHHELGGWEPLAYVLLAALIVGARRRNEQLMAATRSVIAAHGWGPNDAQRVLTLLEVQEDLLSGGPLPNPIDSPPSRQTRKT